jgi:hypothetical protein
MTDRLKEIETAVVHAQVVVCVSSCVGLFYQSMNVAMSIEPLKIYSYFCPGARPVDPDTSI